MPLDYTVSSDGKFVHAVGTGTLTTEEVLAFQKDLQQDNRVKPGYKMLFDESRISESRIDEPMRQSDLQNSPSLLDGVLRSHAHLSTRKWLLRHRRRSLYSIMRMLRDNGLAYHAVINEQ
jgi:hypothetical protein